MCSLQEHVSSGFSFLSTTPLPLLSCLGHMPAPRLALNADWLLETPPPPPPRSQHTIKAAVSFIFDVNSNWLQNVSCSPCSLVWWLVLSTLQMRTCTQSYTPHARAHTHPPHIPSTHKHTLYCTCTTTIRSRGPLGCSRGRRVQESSMTTRLHPTKK